MLSLFGFVCYSLSSSVFFFVFMDESATFNHLYTRSYATSRSPIEDWILNIKNRIWKFARTNGALVEEETTLLSESLTNLINLSVRRTPSRVARGRSPPTHPNEVRNLLKVNLLWRRLVVGGWDLRSRWWLVGDEFVQPKVAFACTNERICHQPPDQRPRRRRTPKRRAVNPKSWLVNRRLGLWMWTAGLLRTKSWRPPSSRSPVRTVGS